MRRMIEFLAEILGLIGGIFLFALIFGIGIDVTLRGITGRGIPAIAEYADVFLVALVYLSLPYTQATGGHVVVEMALRNIPVRLASFLELVGILVVIAVLLAVNYYVLQVAIRSYYRGEYRLGLTGALIWPARWAIVFGLLSWKLGLLLRMTDLIRSVRDGRDRPVGSSNSPATL